MREKKIFNADAIEKASKLMGSYSRLAIETKVTRDSVMKWKNSQSIPSLENCLRIEHVTEGKVKAIDIRPDLVDVLKVLKNMIMGD